jgi:signal transduction histidine kinase
LREVTRELGRLNESVVVELDEFACANAGLEPRVMPTARRVWAALCSTAIEESTAQFFHLQQREAAGHLGELEKALQAVRELDQERTELWRQAAHDLRGNLSVVANATAGLAAVGLRESAADQVLKMLQRNVGALHHLLNDVTSLARLQAGQEQRQLARIDVAALLSDLSEGLRPFAQQRHLFLHCEGPAPFHVDGDAVKIRRIAQNLMLNAIKYTVSGGLNVTWGNSDGGDGKRWALGVRDTGPGLHSGSAAPVAQAIENATQAQQSAEPNTPLPNVANRDARSGDHTTAGEGIGLSIVKRLCDLLDATVELESTPGVGTTFRILLPRAYSG